MKTHPHKSPHKRIGTKNSDLFLKFIKNILISECYKISTFFAYLFWDMKYVKLKLKPGVLK